MNLRFGATILLDAHAGRVYRALTRNQNETFTDSEKIVREIQSSFNGASAPFDDGRFVLFTNEGTPDLSEFSKRYLGKLGPYQGESADGFYTERDSKLDGFIAEREAAGSQVIHLRLMDLLNKITEVTLAQPK